MSRTPSWEGLFCLQPCSAPPNTKRDFPGDPNQQVSKKSQPVHAQPLSSPSICYLSQPSYKLSTPSGCHLEHRWVWKDRVGNTQNVRAHHRSQQHMRRCKIVSGRRGDTEISNIWPGPSTAELYWQLPASDPGGYRFLFSWVEKDMYIWCVWRKSARRWSLVPGLTWCRPGHSVRETCRRHHQRQNPSSAREDPEAFIDPLPCERMCAEPSSRWGGAPLSSVFASWCFWVIFY